MNFASCGTLCSEAERRPEIRLSQKLRIPAENAEDEKYWRGYIDWLNNVKEIED